MTLWSQMGWERSPLGYPTSDEQDTAHHAARFNHFQHGDIYWDAGRGAYEVYPRPAHVPGDPTAVGRWEVPDHNAGIDGLHAALLHIEALWFLSYREPADPDDPGPIPSPFGDSAVLDLTSHSVATPSYHGPNGVLPNLFCGGHAFFPDGRLLVVGGDREDQTRLRSLHVFTPGGPGEGSGNTSGRCPRAAVSLRGHPPRRAGPDRRRREAAGRPVATRNTTYEVVDPATLHLDPPVDAAPLRARRTVATANPDRRPVSEDRVEP